MPQKKNPDPLELVRGKAGRVIGRLAGWLATMKGLPSGYNKDLQEDKEALFDAEDTLRGVARRDGVGRRAGSDDRIADDDRARGVGLLLATDVADYLVAKGVPFRDAHEIVGALVRRLRATSGASFDALTLDEWRAHSPLFDDDVRQAITRGGVGREEADAAVDPSRCRRRGASGSAGMGEGVGVILSRPPRGRRRSRSRAAAAAVDSRDESTPSSWQSRQPRVGVKPVAIWHSGKLRARQTAEPFLRLCNPLAEFSAIKGLQPTDSPGLISGSARRRGARGDARRPHAEPAARAHAPRHRRRIPLLSFPLHGAIALEPSGERWIERWRI